MVRATSNAVGHREPILQNNMQNNMQTYVRTNAGIHCKVSCNDQYRRFFFNGSQFCQLNLQVKQLLGLDKEFVLKYKDTEGDLITISSDEELACAITYSDGNILRLSAIPAESTPAPTTTTTGPFSPELFWGRRGGRGGCGRGRWGEWGPEGRGRRGGWGGRGGCGRGRWGECGPDAWKSKLVFKRDVFKSVLAELQQYPELTPEQQEKKEWTQAKLTRIEARLEKIENGGIEDEGKERKEWKHDRCERKKWRHDKMHKCEKKKWKHDKKAKVVLSEEEQTQIAMIKSQIDLIKPGLKEVKNQLKVKKDVLKEAKATGMVPDNLTQEVNDLKEKKKNLKNQIKPLKKQVKQLKYEHHDHHDHHDHDHHHHHH